MQLSILLALINNQVSLKLAKTVPERQITHVVIGTTPPQDHVLAIDPSSAALIVTSAEERLVVATPRVVSTNTAIQLLAVAGDQFLLTASRVDRIGALALDAITAPLTSTLRQAANLIERPLALLPLQGQSIIASSSPLVAAGSTLANWLASHVPSLDPSAFYHHVILTSPKDAPMPMLLTPLEFHGRPLGYLAMPAITGPILEWQPQLLAALAPLITSAAMKDQVLDTVSTRDQLLDQLLNPAAENNLAVSFAAQHAQLPEAMVLLVCTPDGDDTPLNLKARLEYLATPMFSQVLATVHHHRALLLVSLSLVEFHSPAFRQHLTSIASRAACQMVVSVFYTHAEDTLAALTLCLRAEGLPEPAARVHYASDEFFDLMLDQLPYSSSVLPFLLDPAVAALNDHDHHYQRDYLKTIRAYLAANGNLTETAEALYIHPNTLRKRLMRVTELTGIDLQDAATRLKLAAGLALLDYLQRLATPGVVPPAATSGRRHK